MPRILVTGLPNHLQGTLALRELLIDSLPNCFERHPGFLIHRNDVSAHAPLDTIDDRPLRIVTFNMHRVRFRNVR